VPALGVRGPPASNARLPAPAIAAGVLVTTLGAAGSPARILIVDAYDERDMYAEALRDYGFIITTAATVSAARTLRETQNHDLIVHDLIFLTAPAGNSRRTWRSMNTRGPRRGSC
jgi:hypothetical protein